MKRNVYVSYDGNCPYCGVFQSSKRPENVDIECWKCKAKKGTILYIENIKGYEDRDNTIEIAIETSENIIIIRDYNPEILINKKKEIAIIPQIMISSKLQKVTYIKSVTISTNVCEGYFF